MLENFHLRVLFIMKSAKKKDMTKNDKIFFLKSKKIIIGKKTFIGARTFILPGVKVGDNVIIGACSVVTKDVPDNTTAVGNPAKVRLNN